MNKFRVGDVVVSLSARYTITTKGWVGTVTRILIGPGFDGEDIEVTAKDGQSFPVQSQYFKLQKAKIRYKHGLPSWF
jgi:hypothetical protein